MGDAVGEESFEMMWMPETLFASSCWKSYFELSGTKTWTAILIRTLHSIGSYGVEVEDTIIRELDVIGSRPGYWPMGQMA
jgi:hypothetical protein